MALAAPIERYRADYPGQLIEWARQRAALAQLEKPPTMPAFWVDVAYPEWDHVSYAALQYWTQVEPPFADAVEACRACYEMWLDTTNSREEHRNNTQWSSFAAKNRLRWTDRQDVTTAGRALPAAAGAVVVAEPASLVERLADLAAAAECSSSPIIPRLPIPDASGTSSPGQDAGGGASCAPETPQTAPSRAVWPPEGADLPPDEPSPAPPVVVVDRTAAGVPVRTEYAAPRGADPGDVL